MRVWIEAPFDCLPIEGYRKQRYWMMAEAFVAAGHEVVYWTSDFSHAEKKKRRLTGAERQFDLELMPTLPYASNVSLMRIRSHRAYAREWGCCVERRLKDGLEPPDVMICALPPISTGLVAIRLSRRFNARLVIDMQDAWPETFYRLLPKGFRWLGRLLFAGLRRSVRKICRAADLVTGVCDRYGDLVREYGAKAYYRAYLGIELWNAERQKPSETEPLRLVYVGNLGKSYDLDTVVEGVRILNEKEHGRRVTLDVAGFGGRLAADENVTCHGMLNQEELHKLMASCEIGIIPMRSDSFVGLPNKLGEYAAAGLKVVSSLAGETERLISEFGCGESYQPGDARSFATAVLKATTLSTDGSLRLARERLSSVGIYRDYVTRICAL